MKFLQYSFDAGPQDVVRVTLNIAANVRLLDHTNFQSYRSGRAHKYVGGYYRQSPVLLRPPHQGHWYVAIDLGGARGTLSASCEVV